MSAQGQETNLAIERAAALKISADHLLRDGQILKAIEDYQKAIRLDSTNTALYFNLAIAHYSNNDMTNSALTLEKLVELNPRDTEALYDLACTKLYCTPGSAFTRLIEEGVGFANIVNELDPTKKSLLFALLRQGAPPLN